MEIITKRGQRILIDVEDFEKANKGKSLFVMKNGFVVISKRVNRSLCKHVFLHKILMDCPVGLQVDHINGDRLNNRKSNLRICDHAQNNQNKGKIRGAFSYKGIIKDHRRSKVHYFAKIQAYKKVYRSKSYNTIEEAAHAYDILAKQYHGEFAKLNFPEKRKKEK